MPTDILQLATTATALSIDAHNLASSSTRVGVQSAIVDNTVAKFKSIILHVKVKLGTSPTGNTAVYVHLIRSDGTIRDDNAAAAKGALTQLNAALIGTLRTKAVPATGDILERTFLIHDIGGEWAVLIWHDTGVNTNTTAASSAVQYQGLNAEIQ